MGEDVGPSSTRYSPPSFPDIMLCNARSLNNKLDELKVIHSCYNPSILIITETWLNNTIPDSFLSLEGKSLFRLDRSDRLGGGIICWIKNIWHFINISFSSICPLGVECMWLHSSKLHVLICIIYIPPNLSFVTLRSLEYYLIDCIDCHLNVNTNDFIFLAGDMNNFKTDSLCDQLDLANIVTIPTRGDSYLDKILVSNTIRDSYNSIITHPPLDSSDHIIIHALTKNIASTNSSCNYVSVRDLRESNITGFLHTLANLDWHALYSCPHIDGKVAIFNNYLLTAYDKIPSKIVKFSNKDKSWITPIVKLLINKRWEAFRNGDMALFSHYKAKVKLEILKCKSSWADKLKNHKRGIWNVIDHIKETNSRSHQHFTHLIDYYGTTSNLSNAIKNYFNSIFVDDPISDEHRRKVMENNTEDRFSPVTDQEVYDQLTKIKSKSAPGLDGITSTMLKVSRTVISGPLSHIINACVQTSTFPSSWKSSVIIPIPKKPRPELADLRPISLLPIVSKVAERIILSRVKRRFLDCYDEFQFGFRPHESSTTALIWLLEKLCQVMDDTKNNALLVSLDFTKAFDRVSFNKLIGKLVDCGLPGWFLRFICDYLTRRQFCVKVGKSISSSICVRSGVPQGSVLGPVLFALFVNDLKTNRDYCQIIKYADDTCLVISTPKGSSYSDFILDSINMVEKWADENLFLLNKSKTKCMIMGYNTCKSYSSIAVDDNLVTSSAIKVLGVNIDHGLTWRSHISDVVRRQACLLYILRALKSYNIRSDKLYMIYSCLIKSIGLYASSVFVGLSKYQSEKLDVIHKRAHRIACGDECISAQCNFNKPLDQERLEAAVNLFDKIRTNPNSLNYSFVPTILNKSGKFISSKARTNWKLNSFFNYVTRHLNSKLTP